MAFARDGRQRSRKTAMAAAGSGREAKSDKRLASRLGGKLVVVTGGSGFFGAHVVQELLARSARLRIIARQPEKAWRLRPLANLGQMQFVRGDVTRPASLAAAFAGANAAVKLVGAFAGNLEA